MRLFFRVTGALAPALTLAVFLSSPAAAGPTTLRALTAEIDCHPLTSPTVAIQLHNDAAVAVPGGVYSMVAYGEGYQGARRCRPSRSAAPFPSRSRRSRRRSTARRPFKCRCKP